MTLTTGATPVQYSRRGFAENRKYQATGSGPRSVRRVSIIRRPITVRPVPPAVRYARVREGGRRKTETIPGALDGRLDGDYRALTRFKNSVCRGRGRNRNARPSPGPRDRAGRNSAAAGSESRNARNTALRVKLTAGNCRNCRNCGARCDRVRRCESLRLRVLYTITISDFPDVIELYVYA